MIEKELINQANQEIEGLCFSLAPLIQKQVSQIKDKNNAVQVLQPLNEALSRIRKVYRQLNLKMIQDPKLIFDIDTGVLVRITPASWKAELKIEPDLW